MLFHQVPNQSSFHLSFGTQKKYLVYLSYDSQIIVIPPQEYGGTASPFQVTTPKPSIT